MIPSNKLLVRLTVAEMVALDGLATTNSSFGIVYKLLLADYPLDLSNDPKVITMYDLIENALGDPLRTAELFEGAL